MIHRDTVCLLRECDAGLRMGVASIDDVLEHVRSDDFREALCACRSAHERLGEDIRAALGRFGDEGKAPNAMARGMAWLKTRAELSVSPTDATAAKLIRDGCEMGVSSLRRYLAQYRAADDAARDIARRLIGLEEELGAAARAQR